MANVKPSLFLNSCNVIPAHAVDFMHEDPAECLESRTYGQMKKQEFWREKALPGVAVKLAVFTIKKIF